MKPARAPFKTLLCLTSIYLLLFAFATPLQAGVPMVRTQAPGFYRLMVGQFEVTALSDGWVEMDEKFLGNAPAEEIRKLLDRSFKTGSKLPASSNAYLINTGSRLILVDAGMGQAFGKGFGRLGALMKNLAAAGYKPSQVDAVLITHMHGDHIGGLLTPSGERAFAKADVYVAKSESDFFLSKETAAKMPAAYQPFFKLARDVAAPYIAAGKWKTFESDLPIPGARPIAIPGHTPGHTAYEITSGDQTLLIWGDVVHNAAAQFMNPDVFLVYDLDPRQAVITRKALFSKVAGGKILVSGMHLAFPGIGRLRADGENACSFVPVDFSPVE